MSLSKRTLQPVLGHTAGDLVRSNHPYRMLLAIVPFEKLCLPLKGLYSDKGRGGYPVETMFKASLLQLMENLSDREVERFLQENLAGKLFCGFELTEATPDFSTFCVFRDRIGTEGLALLFNQVRDALKDAGLVTEIFTFVDATHLISKVNLWKERDRLIAEGELKLSNATVAQVAADPEARFGKKGKTKWYGYKIHVGVDMHQGFITKVATTPANVEDTKAARHVMPRSGSVHGDKAYGVGESAREMRRRGLHSNAILKKGMKDKNPELDRFRSGVRAPYESTFARFEKRTRYRGVVKCQFQAFMQALSHNMKRLVKIGAPPLTLRPQCA